MPSFTSDDRWVPVKDAVPPASAGALVARLRIKDEPVEAQRARVHEWLSEHRAPERLLRSLQRRGLIPADNAPSGSLTDTERGPRLGRSLVAPGRP